MQTQQTNPQNIESKSAQDLPQNKMQNAQESLKFTEQEKQELRTLREQTKTKMKPLLNKKITNKRDNTQAYITMSGLKEMLSSKSIMQSVKNGFTKEQHIQASQKIHELFEDAVFQNRNIPRHPKPLVELMVYLSLCTYVCFHCGFCFPVFYIIVFYALCYFTLLGGGVRD